MSNIVIKYPISLLDSECQMSQCFCVDRDIFAHSFVWMCGSFSIRIKKMHFQKGPGTCGWGFTLHQSEERQENDSTNKKSQ